MLEGSAPTIENELSMALKASASHFRSYEVTNDTHKKAATLNTAHRSLSADTISLPAAPMSIPIGRATSPSAPPEVDLHSPLTVHSADSFMTEENIPSHFPLLRIHESVPAEKEEWGNDKEAISNVSTDALEENGYIGQQVDGNHGSISQCFSENKIVAGSVQRAALSPVSSSSRITTPTATNLQEEKNENFFVAQNTPVPFFPSSSSAALKQRPSPVTLTATRSLAPIAAQSCDGNSAKTPTKDATRDVVWIFRALKMESVTEDRLEVMKELKKLAKTADDQFWEKNSAQVKQQWPRLTPILLHSLTPLFLCCISNRSSAYC